jgi:hypothetical protein
MHPHSPTCKWRNVTVSSQHLGRLLRHRQLGSFERYTEGNELGYVLNRVERAGCEKRIDLHTVTRIRQSVACQSNRPSFRTWIHASHYSPLVSFLGRSLHEIVVLAYSSAPVLLTLHTGLFYTIYHWSQLCGGIHWRTDLPIFDWNKHLLSPYFYDVGKMCLLRQISQNVIILYILFTEFFTNNKLSREINYRDESCLFLIMLKNGIFSTLPDKSLHSFSRSGFD